jgi:Na+/melibiose symporter-like transporter
MKVVRVMNKNDEITKKERFIFASADIYGGGGQTIISVIYLAFLIQIINLSPGLAGTLMMISKAWDAINDPLMGMISDRTKTKIGRRRPYILIGGILLIPAIALLWLPNGLALEWQKATYMLITFLFYHTINTIIAVPYSALSTEITNDFQERNKVNLTRLIFSLSSTAICTLVPTMLFERVTDGEMTYLTFYFIIVLVFGSLFAIPNVLVGFFTKERATFVEPEKFSFKQFFSPLKIKSFRKLVFMYIAQAIALDMTSAVILFYGLYVVNISSTIFLGIFLGTQILMYPFLYKMVNKVSKAKIYYFGLPLTALASIFIAFYPTTFPVWGLYLIVVLAAIGFAGALLMSWIIFPDVVDIIELKEKERNTGVASGVMTLIRTASSAISVFIIGWVLQLTGFITPTDDIPRPEQPTSAVLGIRMVIVLALCILVMIGYFVARSLKINPEISKDIKYLNEKRNSDDKLTEEEIERQENYIKELC